LEASEVDGVLVQGNPFVIKYEPGETNVANPVSRNPLLYHEETPEAVIAAASFGVMVAICASAVTRARSNSAAELR
jgi:hypothetical protein